MYHASFAKTMVFYIFFRDLGRKIKLKTVPKSPEGDLKLQPYRNYAFLTAAI